MVLCILCQGIPEDPAPRTADALACRCVSLRVERMEAEFSTPHDFPGRPLSIYLGHDWTGQFGTFVDGYGCDGGWPLSSKSTLERVLRELLCEAVLAS